MARLTGVLLFLFLASCSSDFIGVEELGLNSDFSDIKIEDDFEAPEDEPIDDNEPDDVSEVPPPNTDLPNPDIPMPGDKPFEYKVDTFFIENTVFQLAHDRAVRWDGCQKSFSSQGGYNSDSRCGRGFLHPKFAEHLNAYFFRCVQDAAMTAGYSQPSYVFIRHLGTYNDRVARNSTRLSNHAYARAMDIAYFNLYDEEGSRIRVSTLLRDYSEEQAAFYDEFRDCWKESIEEQCNPGQTEYKGSIGHRSSKLGGNSLHNDHIHLSFPICAG
jgi:hypothetical protein